MKSILFGTTALVVTAGIASADVTFSGKGEAGVYQTSKVDAVTAVGTDGTVGTAGTTLYAAAALATALDTLADAQTALAAAASTATDSAAHTYDDALNAVVTAQVGVTTAETALAKTYTTKAVSGKAAGDMVAYSGYDMNVAVSAETDSGMTFAMGFDMGAGLIADQDDDRVMDSQGATIGTSALTVTANGYTFKIGQDKIDDLYDDSQNGDVSIAGAMGGLTYNIVHDLDDDVAAAAESVKAGSGTAGTSDFVASSVKAAVAAVNNTTSYSFGYAVNDATSLSLVGTSGNDANQSANKISLSYTVSDTLSLKLGHDSKGDADGITSLSATYAIDALTITASYADDKDHSGNTNEGGKASTNLKVGYSQGAVTATFATDESSAWWVNTKYDLGGGASAFATVDHTEFAVAGLSFAF